MKPLTSFSSKENTGTRSVLERLVKCWPAGDVKCYTSRGWAPPAGATTITIESERMIGGEVRVAWSWRENYSGQQVHYGPVRGNGHVQAGRRQSGGGKANEVGSEAVWNRKEDMVRTEIKHIERELRVGK